MGDLHVSLGANFCLVLASSCVSTVLLQGEGSAVSLSALDLLTQGFHTQ